MILLFNIQMCFHQCWTLSHCSLLCHQRYSHSCSNRGQHTRCPVVCVFCHNHRLCRLWLYIWIWLPGSFMKPSILPCRMTFSRQLPWCLRRVYADWCDPTVISDQFLVECCCCYVRLSMECLAISSPKALILFWSALLLVQNTTATTTKTTTTTTITSIVLKSHFHVFLSCIAV